MGHDHNPEHADASMPHPHPARADLDDTLTYYRAMEMALRELLIERGILDANEIHRQVEEMDSRTPAQGARVVARAWVDPEYRKLLRADGNAACAALGIDRGPYKLVVVENTPETHNVIVCTLCSCYP